MLSWWATCFPFEGERTLACRLAENLQHLTFRNADPNHGEALQERTWRICALITGILADLGEANRWACHHRADNEARQHPHRRHCSPLNSALSTYLFPRTVSNRIVFSPSRRVHGAPAQDKMVACANFLLRHAISTTNPPRARSPFTDPFGQAEGRAGSTCRSPVWLCSSISAMPDVAPKLPSIWKGGCKSNRFGAVRSGVRRSVCSLWARSPS